MREIFFLGGLLEGKLESGGKRERILYLQMGEEVSRVLEGKIP